MEIRHVPSCYAMRDTDWVEAVQWHRHSKESFEQIQAFLGKDFSMHTDENGWLFIEKRQDTMPCKKTVCHHVPPGWMVIKTRGSHIIVCSVEALEDAFYETCC